MEDILSTRDPVRLQQIDPSRSRARMYHIAESTSLFGELGLVITWGRIGRRPRIRFEPFSSETELLSRRRELLAKRFAHGYELVQTNKHSGWLRAA